jgi:hypothetical protein
MNPVSERTEGLRSAQMHVRIGDAVTVIIRNGVLYIEFDADDLSDMSVNLAAMFTPENDEVRMRRQIELRSGLRYYTDEQARFIQQTVAQRQPLPDAPLPVEGGPRGGHEPT